MAIDEARRRARWCAARLLIVALAVPVAVAAPMSAAAAPLVACSYRFTPWSGGFSADVTVTNYGPAINGWKVHWTFGAPTAILAGWQANLAVHDGTDVSATNMAYNAVIRTGQVTTFGWTATAASTSAPTDMTVNGIAC
jgi:hypothetical protein